MAVTVLCVAAALSLWAAALRQRQPAPAVDSTNEQGIREQLDSVPEVDVESEAVASRLLGSSEPTVRTSGAGVADEAGAVLQEYAVRSDCVLGRAGYLGLAGDSWACLACGGDWAEVCVVTGSGDEGSEVRTWRITSSEVERLGVG